MENFDMQAEIQLRQSMILKAVQDAGADAIILADGMNLYYATGAVFNGYFYMGCSGEVILFVRRPAGMQSDQVEYIRKPEDIPGILARRGIETPSTLLLEGDQMSYNEHLRHQSALAPSVTGNATALMRSVRSVKTPWEVEQFRISARIHMEVYSAIPELYRPGMTDLELQHEIEYLMRRKGSIGLFRSYGPNMEIFMGSLLAGENAEAPSPFDFALGGKGGETTPIGANGTPLKEGTTFMVDMAGNYTPYITDISRTFAIGKLPEHAYRAHQVSIDIQNAVMDIAREGTPCADIYNVAAQMAEQAGLSSSFMGTRQQAKFVGHGIGLQINELPVMAPRSKETLQVGTVFALEPKFVIEGVGAVGVENSFAVGEDSLELLTGMPEQIIEL